MPTVLIAINEKYPYYEFGTDKNSDSPIEVSEEKLAEWKKGFASFQKLQDEIKQLIDPQPLDPNDPKNTTIDGRAA